MLTRAPPTERTTQGTTIARRRSTTTTAAAATTPRQNRLNRWARTVRNERTTAVWRPAASPPVALLSSTSPPPSPRCIHSDSLVTIVISVSLPRCNSPSRSTSRIATLYSKICSPSLSLVVSLHLPSSLFISRRLKLNTNASRSSFSLARARPVSAVADPSICFPSTNACT